MAEYGVNIAVAVKNSQAITNLSRETDLLGQKIKNINKNLTDFADLNGKTVVNSVSNFNKELANAAKNLNDVSLSSDKAIDAARAFAKAQDLANESIRQQAELLARVRNEGRGVTQYELPIGPNAASMISGKGGFSPGAGSTVASSPVAERIARELQAAKDLEEVRASLGRLEQESVKTIQNKNNLLEQGLKTVKDTTAAVKDTQQARSQEKLRSQRKFQEFEDQAVFKRSRRAALLDRARIQSRFDSDLKNQQILNANERRNIKINADLELARKKQNEIALQRIKQRPVFSGGVGQAVGSGLIGGAFPLLFGQGVGAAAGGAAGGLLGGAIGGQFGFALSLVGTQLGLVADEAVAFAAALDPLKPDFDVLKEKLGATNSATGRLIDRYVELEEQEKALELATEELTRLVGDDGVDALTKFGDDSEKLASTFAQAMTVMTIGLVRFIQETGAVLGLTKELEKKVLISQASVSDDPVLRNLAEEREQFKKQAKDFSGPLPFSLGRVGEALGLGNPRIARESQEGFERAEGRIISLQTAANAKREKDLEKLLSGLGTSEESENAKQGSKRLAQNKAFVAGQERSLALAQADSEFDKAKIAAKNKLEKTMERIAKINNIDLKTKAESLAKDQFDADIKKANVDELGRKERAQSEINKETERANSRQQRAIEKRIKAVDREIERTENAFNKASQQLDSITQKHEDKMAFEREYSRLIMEGSTPAAAKQAVELKKQLLELDRGYEKLLQTVDAQIVKAEASLQDLKNQKGVTNEYIEQQKALDKLKEDRDSLEGRKGTAKGAIGKDLAPETGADKIQAELDRVQGALNDLVDPANQVILAAQAIGDAFSESFRGLITGSMSAQEALANLFSRTADHFADMAAQMIAKAIQMKVLGIALNMFSAGAAVTTPPSTIPGGATQTGLGLNINGVDQGINPLGGLGIIAAAEGAFVSGPTRALIGEGGESEYVVPASKMNEAMGRYARGARGAAVIPDGSGGDVGGEMGGGGGSIDVSYSVERINNVNYVTAAEFEKGMAQAAKRGAEMGKRGVYSDLVNKRSIRSRVGI